MRPFFSYYGGKWRMAHVYGPPQFPIVVEPFAGSAGYSTRWNVKCAHLYDMNARIAAIWEYLISATKEDIAALPLLSKGERLDDDDFAHLFANRETGKTRQHVLRASAGGQLRTAATRMPWTLRQHGLLIHHTTTRPENRIRVGVRVWTMHAWQIGAEVGAGR
jgi:hypothetical protein